MPNDPEVTNHIKSHAKALGSLRETRLEQKLTLTFGFMSVIPILITVWAMVSAVPLSTAIYPMVLSALGGYFLIARPMIHSVIKVVERIRALSTNKSFELIAIDEHNEIGELARSFNRITQDLEHKINELESSRDLVKKLLARIGTAINSYEGIDNLLNLIVENTAGALEAKMGNLMLVDGEKQELTMKTAWSSNGQTADPAFRMKLGDGVSGWVAKEGRAMRGTCTPATIGFLKAANEEAHVLCVPLKLRDHPIGAITVLRAPNGHPFVEDDEMLLASIGSQVAVAIENYRLNMDVERTYLETILALALAVEAKDPYSAGHSKRVGFYASQIGEEMGLDQEMLRVLNDGGILHDIGKIGIKDEILLKATPLTPDEHKIMQQHSIIGEAIVKPVRSLAKVVDLVRHHHERFDGGGYPSGLKGETIPLGARILAVADAYDAMMTDRPYRKRISLEETKAELKRCAGQQHDPVIVEAFMRVLAKKEARLAAGKDQPTPSSH